MKKIIFILLLFCLFLLNGCESKSNYQVSIIVPSGTLHLVLVHLFMKIEIQFNMKLYLEVTL